MDNTPSFFSRLAIAFKLIFSGQYAQSILQPSAAAPKEDTPAEVTEETPQPVNYDSALQLIAILQKDGRLIDFIQEDVNQFSDEQVAAFEAQAAHQHGIVLVMSALEEDPWSGIPDLWRAFSRSDVDLVLVEGFKQLPGSRLLLEPGAGSRRLAVEHIHEQM